MSGKTKLKRISGEICRGAVMIMLAMMILSSLTGNQAEAEEPEGELIDRVIAVVEGRAILQSELELEYKRYMMQEGREDLSRQEKKEVRGRILDILVNDLLMAVHAENRGIEIDETALDDQVEEAIQNSMREMGGEEQFERSLEREGLTLSGLRKMWREKLRARKLVEKLWAAEVMGEARVSEAEVKEYYRNHAEELPTRPASVKLAQILLEPAASRDKEKEALEEIRRYQKMLEEGKEFSEVAREYSEGPSADYGGSLGYVKLEELGNPEFAEAVRELKVGEVSGPVLTKFGYHLIKLEDISDQRVLVSHILVQAERDLEAERKTLELAGEIRKELTEGADFAEMARKHSDDPATGERGGLVGEIALRRLPREFRESIEDLEEGGVSEVIQDDKGFRIVKVLDRSGERPYRYEEAREELRNLIKQQKLQSRVKGYVEGLKEQYTVNIKEDIME